MKQLLICSLWVCSIALLGQKDSLPSIRWATGFGGLDRIGVYDGAVDAMGNVIAVGNFRGTIDLDPGPAATTFTSGSDQNVCILKTDSSGNFLWGKAIESLAYVRSLDVTVDNKGGIVLGGFFSQVDSINVSLDPQAPYYLKGDTAKFTGFLAKLDDQGNFLWANGQLGGICTDVFTDSAGNIYVLGTFYEAFDTDPDPSVQSLVTPMTIGKRDFYVEKFDSLGNQMWIKVIKGQDNTRASALTVADNGDVIVTGFIEGSTNFNPGSVPNYVSPNAPYSGFVHVLTNNGVFKDVFLLEGNSSTWILDIEVDWQNNMYLAGEYTGVNTDFDPGPGVWPPVSNATEGYFIMKANQSGQPDWVHTYQHNTTYVDFRSINLSLGSNNKLYVGGNAAYFDVELEPDNPNGVVLDAPSTRSAFQVAYDSSGVLSWANLFEGTPWTDNRKILARGDYLYNFGAFADSLSFNSLKSDSTLLAIGMQHGFILKQKLPATCSEQDTTIEYFACDSLLASNGITYYSDAQYTDSLFTVAQCDSLITYKIFIDSSPNTTVVMDTIFNRLRVVPAGTQSYQWFNCDADTIVPRATDYFFDVQIPGNYAVIVTNGECTDTSACVASLGIGLYENVAREIISIYPNPTDGKLQVGRDKKEIQYIQIYDFSGRLLQKLTSTNKLNISSFPSGIYMVSIKTIQGVATTRIIKE